MIMSKLTQKDVKSAALWWWWTSHMTYNYQRLQAGSLSSMMGPLLEKLYNGDKDKISEGLVRHMQYFNTEPRWGAVIPGMVVALEEGIATSDDDMMDASTIVEIKTALMGPLAGIGDTVWAGLIKPIILSILLGYAMDGAVWAAWAWGLGVTALDFGITYVMFMQGYKFGVDSIDRFLDSGFINKVTTALGIVGLFCLGAMIVKYVGINAILTFEMSTSTVNVGELLNKILPSFLPLLLTYFAYKLQVKGFSVVKVLIILFVIGFAGGAIGLLG